MRAMTRTLPPLEKDINVNCSGDKRDKKKIMGSSADGAMSKILSFRFTIQQSGIVKE